MAAYPPAEYVATILDKVKSAGVEAAVEIYPDGLIKVKTASALPEGDDFDAWEAKL